MASKLRLPSAHVIPNGVDLNLFRPMEQAQARRALGLDPGKKFVLFPYNPKEARKRFDLIEAAVSLARKQVPQLGTPGGSRLAAGTGSDLYERCRCPGDGFHV